MAKSILSDLNLGGVSRLLNLPAPTTDQEPVRLAELNAAIEGLKQKEPVVVASTANINLASPGATIDGVTMVAGYRFLAKDQTTNTQNGFYTWTGAATAASRTLDANAAAELNSALVPVSGGSSASSNFRQTAIVATVGTDPITWASFGTSAGSASTSVPGVVQLATQTILDTGTDTTKVPTSDILAAWVGKKYKYAALVGDGSATQYDLTHNFGTRDAVVNVVRATTPWDNIECDIGRPDTNTVRLNFAAAPTSNQFRAVIIA